MLHGFGSSSSLGLLRSLRRWQFSRLSFDMQDSYEDVVRKMYPITCVWCLLLHLSDLTNI